MQNAEWIALLRQIPKELHSQLVLVAQNRSDISVESICRLDPTYMVIKGRIGGTTEAGLLFMFPYDQISTVYVGREMKEDEIETFLQNMAPVNRLSTPSQQGTGGGSKLPGSATPAGTAKSAVPVAAQARPANDPSSIARNNLLERLRAARNAAMPQNGKQ